MTVAVGVRVGVRVIVGVHEGPRVGVTDTVAVADGVAVSVDVLEAVTVTVAVGVRVAVGVAVACCALAASSGSVRKLATISTRREARSARRAGIVGQSAIIYLHLSIGDTIVQCRCASSYCGWQAMTCA